MHNLEFPPPLMGKDHGTFTERTVLLRLPTITKRVIEENCFPEKIVTKLENLLAEIPFGKIKSIEDNAPDIISWQKYIFPYQGKTWVEVPWFFSEVYLYRRILSYTNFFQEGEYHFFDPFQKQKQQGLENNQKLIKQMSRISNGIISLKDWSDTNLSQFISISLWGNQADMSVWSASDIHIQDIEHINKKDNLLIDESYQVVKKLNSLKTKDRVDILIDNAGFELFCDLFLIDYLLEAGITDQIILHFKPHPTFVSDATINDLEHTLDYLLIDGNASTYSFATRFKEHLLKGRIILDEDFFWTSPLYCWEMPQELKNKLARSCCVIAKGDAHFRRLVGDYHWPYDTSFDKVLSYFPVPLVVLRTLKSEIAINLTNEKILALFQKDVNWMINGKWGLIKYFEP